MELRAVGRSVLLVGEVRVGRVVPHVRGTSPEDIGRSILSTLMVLLETTAMWSASCLFTLGPLLRVDLTLPRVGDALCLKLVAWGTRLTWLGLTDRLRRAHERGCRERSLWYRRYVGSVRVLVESTNA